jgi:choline dehydrogenase
LRWACTAERAVRRRHRRRRLGGLRCGSAAVGGRTPARLSDRGGTDYGPYDEGRWPVDALDGRSLALAHVWPPEDEDRSKLRPRIIGGGSSVNACMLALGPPPDYEWGGGWTYESLLPFADRALDVLSPRRFEEFELGVWHTRLLESSRDAALDATPNLVNMRGTTRWNDAFAYLDPARARGNLSIRSDTVVERLDPPHVVLSTGERVETRLIVLAAGAYGTASLLLQSGLGTGVGEGLQDHPGVGLGWEPVQPARQTTMSQVTLRARSSVARDEYWDTLVVSAEDGPERSAAVFSMTPVSRGAVRAGPIVDHGFLADEDATRIVEGVELARELLGPDVRPGGDADLARHVRENVRGFFHPVGTCALGAVTEPDGRLRGVDGVVCCDASVIPRVPRVPTHLTVLAVAERLVEGWRE